MLWKRGGFLAPPESLTPQVYSLWPDHYAELAATMMDTFTSNLNK
jgi:hypothetical protein